MKKLKAQNTIEIITMVALVGVVVLSAFMFMQGNNTHIANLSKINTGKATVAQTSQASNVSTNTTTTPNNYETAGSLSSTVANMSENEIYDLLKNKTLNDVLIVKTSDNKDIFDLADTLIQENSLKISEFGSNKNIEFNEDVKTRLVEIASQTKNKLEKEQKTSTTYNLYMDLLSQIITD